MAVLYEDRVDSLAYERRSEVGGLELVDLVLDLLGYLVCLLERQVGLPHERLDYLVRVELLDRVPARPHVHLAALDYRALFYLACKAQHELAQVRDRVPALRLVECYQQLPQQLSQMIRELAGLFFRLEAGERLELGISERPLCVEDAQYVDPVRAGHYRENHPYAL